jgi:BirA family biotin operon repressor/biotin-[acetyl-CoA-carboxylase] ligase
MKPVLFGRPHIRLAVAGSTNTYARQIIEAARPANGTVITSGFQYGGRGQGHHSWESEAGKNLLCSYIFYPGLPVRQLFILNKMLTCAVHQCLMPFIKNESLKIKWPNDLLVNDRKLCGILIETGIKGDMISHCIAGIGINVNQEIFRDYNPKAISIKLLTGNSIKIELLLDSLNKSVTHWFEKLTAHAEQINEYYLSNLYLAGKPAEFIYKETRISGIITDVDDEGQLVIRTGKNQILKVKHGELKFLF